MPISILILSTISLLGLHWSNKQIKTYNNQQSIRIREVSLHHWRIRHPQGPHQQWSQPPLLQIRCQWLQVAPAEQTVSYAWSMGLGMVSTGGTMGWGSRRQRGGEELETGQFHTHHLVECCVCGFLFSVFLKFGASLDPCLWCHDFWTKPMSPPGNLVMSSSFLCP